MLKTFIHLRRRRAVVQRKRGTIHERPKQGYSRNHSRKKGRCQAGSDRDTTTGSGQEEQKTNWWLARYSTPPSCGGHAPYLLTVGCDWTMACAQRVPLFPRPFPPGFHPSDPYDPLIRMSFWSFVHPLLFLIHPLFFLIHLRFLDCSPPSIVFFWGGLRGEWR